MASRKTYVFMYKLFKIIEYLCYAGAIAAFFGLLIIGNASFGIAFMVAGFVAFLGLIYKIGAAGTKKSCKKIYGEEGVDEDMKLDIGSSSKIIGLIAIVVLVLFLLVKCAIDDGGSSNSTPDMWYYDREDGTRIWYYT